MATAIDFVSEDDISDLLECSICLETCQIPIQQCANGHNICKIHVADLPEEVCPVCRVPYYRGGSRNLLAEKLVLKKNREEEEKRKANSAASGLPYTSKIAGDSDNNFCAYFKDGCKLKPSNALSRKDHEEKCDFRPVTCPLEADRCHNSEIPFSKFIEHLKTCHNVFSTSSHKFVRQYTRNGEKLVRNGSSKLCIVNAFEQKFLITAHQTDESVYVWVAIHGKETDGLDYTATIKLVTLDSTHQHHTGPIYCTTRSSAKYVHLSSRCCFLRVKSSVVIKNLNSRPKLPRVKFWSAEIEINRKIPVSLRPVVTDNLHAPVAQRLTENLRRESGTEGETRTNANNLSGGVQPLSEFARDFYRTGLKNNLVGQRYHLSDSEDEDDDEDDDSIRRQFLGDYYRYMRANAPMSTLLADEQPLSTVSRPSSMTPSSTTTVPRTLIFSNQTNRDSTIRSVAATTGGSVMTTGQLSNGSSSAISTGPGNRSSSAILARPTNSTISARPENRDPSISLTRPANSTISVRPANSTISARPASRDPSTISTRPAYSTVSYRPANTDSSTSLTRSASSTYSTTAASRDSSTISTRPAYSTISCRPTNRDSSTILTRTANRDSPTISPASTFSRGNIEQNSNTFTRTSERDSSFGSGNNPSPNSSVIRAPSEFYRTSYASTISRARETRDNASNYSNNYGVSRPVRSDSSFSRNNQYSDTRHVDENSTCTIL